MKTKFSQPPQELIDCHQYYHHLFFKNPPKFKKNNFLKDRKWQKLTIDIKMKERVNRRNLKLAFPNFFKALDKDSRENLIVNFNQSVFAKSFVIHKKVKEFYNFTQQTCKKLFSENTFLKDIFEKDYIYYELLYAEDVKSDDQKPLKTDNEILNFKLGWKTPWQVYKNLLLIRNPKTFLIDEYNIQPCQNFFNNLKNYPDWCLNKVLESVLDASPNTDKSFSIEFLYKTLLFLHQSNYVYFKE